MRITKYEYRDVNPEGWHFSATEFGKINLIVGNSGMGKTRILNTIFNIGSQIAQKNIVPGIWDLTLNTAGFNYHWQLEARSEYGEKPIVISESLEKYNDEKKEILIYRDPKKIIFKNNELPKLSSTESCISILQEEKEINPLFDGFRKIVRRKFFEADLSKRCSIGGFPFGFLDGIPNVKTIKDLYPDLHDRKLNLNAVLYILSKNFSNIYQRICAIYKSVFSFITDIKVLDMQEIDERIRIPGQVPVFCVKEKSINKWITLDELSSGMQKVLLILTDIFTLPDESIYLVDEYENSLGINAINFFPDLLIEEEFNIQFFITSHHPYIINKLPINSWYVFHRIGSKVNILYGEKLSHRFGKSKQQAFIKLLNDSFYIEGKE